MSRRRDGRRCCRRWRGCGRTGRQSTGRRTTLPTGHRSPMRRATRSSDNATGWLTLRSSPRRLSCARSATPDSAGRRAPEGAPEGAGVGDARVTDFYDELASVAGHGDDAGDGSEGHLTFGLMPTPEPGFSWVRALFAGATAPARVRHASARPDGAETGDIRSGRFLPGRPRARFWLRPRSRPLCPGAPPPAPEPRRLHRLRRSGRNRPPPRGSAGTGGTRSHSSP